MVIYPQNAQEQRKFFLHIFAAINLVWVINFGIIHSNALADNRIDFEWGRPLLNEITGAYSAFALVPFLYLLWIRFPLNRSEWIKRLPVYIGATVIVGISHTLLMYSLRDILYPVFGFGEHDIGRLIYRYTMEFQKQIFWIWGMWGLFALGRHIHEYHESRLRAARLQEELSKSQLDTMRQQINPHFLFNSLNLISNKVYESAEEADQLITELSDLLRYSLDMGKGPTIQLHKEIAFLEKYLHIMKERFGDRVCFEIDCDASLKETEVPSFILQPVVENSFKHRLESAGGDLFIAVQITKEGHKLVISIQDKGKAVQGLNSGEGVGLGNIKKRLHNLYPDRASFTHGPIDENQYEVTFSIPTSADQ